jgi:hypothetical protein
MTEAQFWMLFASIWLSVVGGCWLILRALDSIHDDIRKLREGR